MKHSDAYYDFKKQLKAVGRQKMEGYDPDLLDKITESERRDVEKDIWNHFMKQNDADLAVFMPSLKNYDGIAALKKKLTEFAIPSYGSAEIAFALFEAIGEEEYLDIIMDNYRGLSVNTSIAARLARLAKRPGVYALLVDIYLHDKDEVNRVQAIQGILWSDGKLNSVSDPRELSDKIDLIRSFSMDKTGIRKGQGMNHLGTVELITDRLILRRFTAYDAVSVFNNWASDDEVTKYLTWPTHQSIDASREYMNFCVKGYSDPSFYQWGIELKDTHELIGNISVVKVVNEIDSLELGWAIGRKYWGNGYTAEAALEVIDFLFDEVGANCISAGHDVENPNSGRVMHKAGMKFEGILRQSDEITGVL